MELMEKAKRIKHTVTQTKEVTITPDMARGMLDRSDFSLGDIKQRPINPTRVATYAKMMSMGQWDDESPDMILVDIYGRVVNGQNRLRACLSSGVSFGATIKYGVSPDVIHICDKGKPRSISDDMYVNGIKCCRAVASSSRLIWAYNKGRILSSKRGMEFTYFDSMSIIEKYPPLMDMAAFVCARNKLMCKIIAESWTVFFLTVLHKHYKTESILFWEKMCSGEGLVSGDPMICVRKQWETWIQSTNRGPNAIYKGAIVALAWNKFVQGQSVKRILWNGQEFPEIIGAQKAELSQ